MTRRLSSVRLACIVLGALGVVLGLAANGGARAQEDLSACYEGSAAQAAGDHELAIAHYNQCIRIGNLSFPNLAVVLYNRGTSFQFLGESEEAVRNFTRAIEINPRKANAYNGRCWSTAHLGRPEDALADCDESLRLVPDDPYALDSRALVHWMLGERDKAKADLKRARKLDPSFPTWRKRFKEFEEKF
jgi:tetratricopeptide (TPR) repeat protein